ncbi:hypothetical protein MRB53_011856 [Persea americana]|uniref:Uncharacterized protein n=1 Tax=Persea americana TaxID=3435 RepID=A0ACC2LX28_PERAE|nr:hypothetical protein MRB53_011856 [Persea americana]
MAPTPATPVLGPHKSSNTFSTPRWWGKAKRHFPREEASPASISSHSLDRCPSCSPPIIHPTIRAIRNHRRSLISFGLSLADKGFGREEAHCRCSSSRRRRRREH